MITLILIYLQNAFGKVTESEILHRVGAGKVTGLQRSDDFDGSQRTWYEFRGIRYTPKLERFDYPSYYDPIQWGDIYDGTKYRSNCVTQSGVGDEDCLFLNVLVPDQLNSA